jgi:hypothetical protein
LPPGSLITVKQIKSVDWFQVPNYSLNFLGGNNMKSIVSSFLKLRKLIYISVIVLVMAASFPMSVSADPPLPLPRMPICGDQDGSETPFILNCPDFVNNPDVQAYQVNSKNPIELKFDFVFREASYNNELGYFLVDDANFAIGPLHPGDTGYLTAAFNRAKIIFPSGSDAFTPDVTFSFEPGDILVFFIIQDNTLTRFLESNPNNDVNKLPLAFFSIDKLNPDGVDHFVGFQNQTGVIQFGFEDLTGGGDRDYDDVVYNLSGPVSPVQVVPPFTTSYYVQTKNQTTMKGLGYELGIHDGDLEGVQDDIVILMFGMPMFKNGQYGDSLYAAGFAPTSEIEGLVEQFAAGYYTGVVGRDKQSHLRIVVGTSNCKTDPKGLCKSSTVTAEHGRAWGQMVNNIASWIINNRISSQVDVAGGSDMELSWDTPSETIKWVDGYASVSTRYLYDFGDAAGCPPVGNCINGWNYDNILHVSWESPPAWPLPQDYSVKGTNAKQWQLISLNSSKKNFPRMVIAGSLTQYQACHDSPKDCVGQTDNSPEDGWIYLWDALNSDINTSQQLRWSTDIMWGPK